MASNFVVDSYQSVTQAQSATNKDGGLLGSLVAPNQQDLLMDIYSGGVPTPKAPQSPAPQPRQPSPVKVVKPSSPVVVFKEAPQNPQPQVKEFTPQPSPVKATPAVEVNDDSSKFSSDAEQPKNEKDLLRQKLAALKEKLKKVKSIEDKQKMLEQERDKELRQKETMKRKADAKALQKKKEVERKQHSQIQERESVRKPAPVKQSQPKATPVKKAQPQKPAQQKPLDANASEEQIDFNNKLHLVDELAKRWWYALPQWPPENFDYQTELKRRELELVESCKLREESKLKRVCQVEAYPGVYRDQDQKLYDLRPQESIPSLQNFQRKTVNELQILLKTAYEEQSRVVQEMLDGKLPSYDRETEVEISQSLGKKLKRIGRYV